jgi:hypothetical protein
MVAIDIHLGWSRSRRYVDLYWNYQSVVPSGIYHSFKEVRLFAG